MLEAQGQMAAKVVHVSDATSNQGSTEWLASDFLAQDLGFSHWFSYIVYGGCQRYSDNSKWEAESSIYVCGSSYLSF